MAGVGFHIEIQGLARVNDRLNRLIENDAQKQLLEIVGATSESQTRRRISEDKTSPDGEPWADWSKDYAKTRHSGHSLLENEGDLLDSIQYQVSGGEVAIGSNLDYAAIRQFGGAEVGRPNDPAREYLGISDADHDELIDVINDWATGLMSE
ncbi:phage virion morphogenesis protein [Hydrogenovibrio sp. 3SP14C1]|uniref:phage virion morphogenesis protein n=1 Tax=Hydrogenovibrio sp. 3SP14C1 TaxID=3038774 RepID=UPI0024179D7E|nr:phage virion morphogenesis protein [Hydrogenovibrio sp. 3SP14C1]MDG4811660.1 phage virion morphogenesis protein [Hydrogenovibrio sp. 3SP14C1]